MTLSYQSLLQLLEKNRIIGIGKDSIQAASIDLPLTQEVYRMPGSCLPSEGQKVSELIQDYKAYKVPANQPLEIDCYYLVRTKLSLNLPNELIGGANNKSSSGRINLQGRMVLDGVNRYDTIPPGYQGEVWLELHPKLCAVQLDLSDGGAVNQIRLRNRHEEFCMSEQAISEAHLRTPFLYLPSGEPVPVDDLQFTPNHGGILVNVNLNHQIPGFEGFPRKNSLLDLSKRHTEDPTTYFRPIHRHFDGKGSPNLWMYKDSFYILGSHQRVSNPPDYCIYMLPYQVEHGEYRSHYAGFFDPGNGYGMNGEIKGFTVTMEVIPIEDAIEIKDQQIMFAIQIDRMDSRPQKLYGVDFKSNYFSDNGPKLAKFFHPYPTPV